MSKRNGSKEELPEFDHGNYSYRDARRLARLRYEFEHLPEDATFEQQDEIEQRFIEEISKLVVDVPRSWLVNDAPEDIDWSEVDSIDYLRGDKIAKFFELAVGGQAGN